MAHVTVVAKNLTNMHGFHLLAMLWYYSHFTDGELRHKRDLVIYLRSFREFIIELGTELSRLKGR